MQVHASRDLLCQIMLVTMHSSVTRSWQPLTTTMQGLVLVSRPCHRETRQDFAPRRTSLLRAGYEQGARTFNNPLLTHRIDGVIAEGPYSFCDTSGSTGARRAVPAPAMALWQGRQTIAPKVFKSYKFNEQQARGPPSLPPTVVPHHAIVSPCE